MRTYHTLAITALTVGVLSCTSVRPVKIKAGDQCFRCQRIITDTRLAAEQVSGFVEKFRAPGCMAKYVVEHPQDKGPIFVTDFMTGDLIAVDAAFFVPIVLDDTRGERDYRAYALKSDAETAAAALNTAPIVWKTVLDRTRGV